MSLEDRYISDTGSDKRQHDQTNILWTRQIIYLWLYKYFHDHTNIVMTRQICSGSTAMHLNAVETVGLRSSLFQKPTNTHSTTSNKSLGVVIISKVQKPTHIQLWATIIVIWSTSNLTIIVVLPSLGAVHKFQKFKKQPTHIQLWATIIVIWST